MGKKKLVTLNYETVLEIGVFALLSLLPLLWVKPGEVIIGHDSGFRINFLSYYKSLLYAWNPVFNFGSDWQLYKGFLTTQLPEFLVTFLTGSWIIGQRAVMVYWFFLMQCSMYLLAKTIRPEKEHAIFRISVSIFYAYNFFILQAWFIVERAKFSLYAAIPLAILLFYRVCIQKKNVYVHAILFGLLYFFMSGGGSPPLYGATMILWCTSFFFFSWLAWREAGWRGVIRVCRTGFLFGMAFSLFNAFWIIPQIGLYLTTYTDAVAERGGIENFIAWERVNSLNASIVNLFRLQGIPDWYDNPDHAFAASFLRNPILTLASFIPIASVMIGIGMGIVKKKKYNPVVYLAVLLLCIGLFFAGGSHRPFGIIYEYAMRHIPGFAIFRSSFYKFGPLVWFSIIFLSMYFIDAWILRMTKRVFLRRVFGACLVAGILLYHYPFYTANFFQFHRIFSTKVQIPSYVTEMSDYINAKTPLDARILVLPELTTSFNNVRMDAYAWGFFSLDILPRNAIDRSIVANDYHAMNAVNDLYSEFMDGTKEKFQTVMEYLGVRYILWRDDAVYNDAVVKGRTLPFQRQQIELYEDARIYEKGLWKLYDLGEGNAVPLVWAPEGVMVTHHMLFHPLDLLLTTGSSRSAVLEGTSLPEDVIEPECKFCEQDAYDKMVRETPNPSLRYRPGSMLFKRLVNSDKRAIQQTGTDPEALCNALLSHSQFQLAIMALDKKPNGYDSSQAVKDVQTTFLSAQKQLDLLSGRQKNVYAIRLLLFIDVSNRFVSELSSLSEKDTHDLLAFFSSLRSSVYPTVWMTERPEDIKYEFETMQADRFEAVVVNTTTTVGSIEIDGSHYPLTGEISIPKGYHTARITNPSTMRGFAPKLFLKKSEITHVAKPTIRFTKIHPTEVEANIVNAQSPFILVFNEGFDRRWKARIAGEKADIDEKNHGKVNGFANGWYMERTGDYVVKIYYQPQRYFHIGLVVTCATLTAALLSIIVIRMNRK